MLDHLCRSGRAVEPDDIGSHRFEGGERGADLGSEEHAAGGLDGDLDHERDRSGLSFHHLARREHRRLALQQVLDGLDEDGVHTTGEEPFHLRDVGVAKLDESDMPEGWELRPRSDGADHKAWSTGGSVIGRDLACEPGGGLVELTGLVGDAVLGEDDREGAEGGGLDRVDTEL